MAILSVFFPIFDQSEWVKRILTVICLFREVMRHEQVQFENRSLSQKKQGRKKTWKFEKPTTGWRSTLTLCLTSLSLLDATTHLYKRSCASIRPSVRMSRVFPNDKYSHFWGKKVVNNIPINGTISDDGVVASDVPPRYLFCWRMIDG